MAEKHIQHCGKCDTMRSIPLAMKEWRCPECGVWNLVVVGVLKLTSIPSAQKDEINLDEMNEFINNGQTDLQDQFIEKNGDEFKDFCINQYTVWKSMTGYKN